MPSSETNRYLRQTILPEIGSEGQKRLKSTRILCVGAGGLGSPALLYLAAAGIGQIGIIDPDKVDISNLQRQILFDSADQGRSKAEVAKEKLELLNPEIQIESYSTRVNAFNAAELFSNYDIVLDGTDNFSAKYLINDAAFFVGIPVVFGAVLRFEGQVSVFWSKYGPCYRCLYPEPPAGAVLSCAEAGVVGALPGIIGSMQAMEAIKLAMYDGGSPEGGDLHPIIGKFLTLNARSMSWSSFNIETDKECPLCSENPRIQSLVEHPEYCTSINGDLEVNVEELGQLTGVQLVDVREKEEWECGAIPGAIHHPLSQLEGEFQIELPKQGNIVFYCRSGVRSLRAPEIAMSRGVQNAKHLRGGMVAWETSGRKL